MQFQSMHWFIIHRYILHVEIRLQLSLKLSTIFNVELYSTTKKKQRVVITWNRVPRLTSMVSLKKCTQIWLILVCYNSFETIDIMNSFFRPFCMIWDWIYELELNIHCADYLVRMSINLLIYSLSRFIINIPIQNRKL